MAIEVDGGIDESTGGPCAEAGATVFVAGSEVFGAEDPVAAWQAIDRVVSDARQGVRSAV